MIGTYSVSSALGRHHQPSQTKALSAIEPYQQLGLKMAFADRPPGDLIDRQAPSKTSVAADLKVVSRT
jgi:hypothetical protein